MDEEYKSSLGRNKAGSGAKNWRISPKGDFRCPSLKEAWTIYQKFGKQDWYEKGESGKRAELSNELRCVGVTGKGLRCSRKIVDGGCLCRQHFSSLLFT